MSGSHAEEILALADEQLPLAARYGIGHELAQLADALLPDEQPVRVATASLDGTFGVLALTTCRLLWIPAGRSSKVSDWPIAAARPIRNHTPGVIAVSQEGHVFTFRAVLPADAAGGLSDELSGRAGGAPSHHSHRLLHEMSRYPKV
jgi:hypothetical protein